MALELTITPHGRILLLATEARRDDSVWDVPVDASIEERLRQAFAQSSGDGLLELAGLPDKVALPVACVFWRSWAHRGLKAIAALDDEQFAALQRAADSGTTRSRATAVKRVAPPDDLQLAVVASEAPPMRGLEYLTPAVLSTLWSEQVDAFLQRASAAGSDGCSELLRQLNPELQLLGRVTFHLAENKRDAQRPFAFLATYAHRVSARSRVRHLPLAEALRQYASARDQSRLRELLTPVRTAADRSAVVRELLESRGVFRPQAWSIGEAHRFLQDVSIMEDSGLSVRVPDWWTARRPARPQVRVRVGEQAASAVGLDALLDFTTELSLDGEPLTDDEREQLMAATEGLTLLRGRWVEVDQEKLRHALEQWRRLEEAHTQGVTFLEGMRLLAGGPLGESDSADDVPAWSTVVPGEWLAETLRQLRDPSGVEGCEPGVGLAATLRSYQADGVRWLWMMSRLGLGACLADDMGLGKTIQVIDLMLRLQADRDATARRPRRGRPPRSASGGSAASHACLLVVPASLIGNWKDELQRFAPQLRVLVAHRSETDAEALEGLDRDPAASLRDVDAVITTYSMLRRAEWPKSVRWRLAVLDEAQAIKNAGSAQSRAARRLQADARVALTGTPVENQLGDLWSLFDFCVPGLLGTVNEFRAFVRRSARQQDAAAGSALRKLVRPYILRRMKTDPTIVPDLPDKAELNADCGLSKKQAFLYEQLVTEVTKEIEQADGIQRRGLVLSMLMRLKQLCNHPALLLGLPDYDPADSGKFQELRALCEPIRDRQEKVLVFTQFQSFCEPLADYLTKLFGRPGCVLHGGVPVAKRRQRVAEFQESDAVPFFVISVKAGGTGLNLTAASHVIHFDRWWNPAVENQATDRAYRIGQHRNVLVRKFVCRGTLEERIDEMIREKQALADEVLGDGAESLLTEMTDAELREFVSLDPVRARGDD